MPIYEYKCQKCNHKFEKLLFDKQRIHCPKCGSINVKKLISNFNASKTPGHSCDMGSCPSCNLKS